jgi:hypothetical protein
MQPVEPSHDREVDGRHRARQIIDAAAADVQSFRLSGDRQTVRTVNHRFALSRPALLSAPSKLVEQNEQGSWLAYRDDFPLLKKGHPARFASCKEAQRCAEAHEWDQYPGAREIDDGLSWLPDPEIDWRSIPHLAEERANWKRNASNFLP